MPQLAELLRNGKRAETHRRWPRVIVPAEIWQDVAQQLVDGRVTLLGQWGDSFPVPAVHMAVMDAKTGHIAVVSIECPGVNAGLNLTQFAI